MLTACENGISFQAYPHPILPASGEDKLLYRSPSPVNGRGG